MASGEQKLLAALKDIRREALAASNNGCGVTLKWLAPVIDGAIAEYEAGKQISKQSLFAKQQLPTDLPQPNVSVPREKLIEWQQHYSTLGQWAADVCGVPLEELCLLDMMHFQARQVASPERHEVGYYLHLDDNYYWTPEAWAEYQRLKVASNPPPEVTALYEAAKEWCSDTEEDCGYHAEWKALSEALTSYEAARGKS